MRILFCSPTHLSKELGASKVLIELAEELEQLGWRCKMLSPTDLVPNQRRTGNGEYRKHLRQYLHEHASEFDIVEYDHSHLPFPRCEFNPRTLFVARSVLLTHHFSTITIPADKNLKAKIRSLIHERNRAVRHRQGVMRGQVTFNEADLINVANLDDQTELIRCGMPKDKIIVIPYGISRSRRTLFDSVSSTPPEKPKVAFVGTFDNRKGSRDFPKIVADVCAELPDVSFRLLGTYRTEKDVLAYFPRKLRNKIEVIPKYPSEELHKLLEPCSIGVFPSYVEGFGFGVLEMLASSIPVIAYNSPGPPMMLPPEFLVRRGDTKALSAKVIRLLNDPDKLSTSRFWAKQQSQQFSWPLIARQTAEVYVKRWELKQAEVAI